MPDILRVTTPVSTPETNIKPRPGGALEQNIQQIVDPSRVTKTNQQNVNMILSGKIYIAKGMILYEDSYFYRNLR